MIKDKLEIFLITYNRKSFLKKTLDQILSEESPVKDFDIKILDNNSDDGSYELIEEYREKHPSIVHITHNRNIGGNANIARAFEMASKEYVWILCDDDIYNWENWSEAEQSINDGNDVTIVSLHNITDKNNISDIIFQLSFLPAGIYKTSIIDENVIKNVYDNIQNIFPHLPVGISAANKNLKFYVLKKAIVQNGWEIAVQTGDIPSDASYLRGYNESELYATTRNINWHIGYINTLTLLNDKNAIMNGLKSAMTYKLLKNNIFDIVRQVVNDSMKDKKSYNLYYDFFCRVSFPVKLLMIYYRYFPFCFYKTEKGINIQLFNKIRFRLIPFLVKTKKGKHDKNK